MGRALLLPSVVLAALPLLGCEGEIGDEVSGDESEEEGPSKPVDPPPVVGPSTVDCTHKGSGTDYAVGPGQPYATIGEVPFETLKGGDTVRIFHRAEPYREKLMIGGQGTPEQPTRVCGVPGPNGELPVIDGAGATTRPSLSFPYDGHQARGVIVIGHKNEDPYEADPGPIVVEGLAVTGGTPASTFTAVSGATESYSEAAAGIFVQRGRNITIRGCQIYGNANGFFIGTSSGQEATYDVLVEANDVHDNGTPGSDRQHNSYNEAVGITLQFNRFGPPRADSLAGNVKERSAGVVFRYNWVEGGGHQLDLVDAQEAKSTTVSMPEFHESFVYGNVFVRPGTGGSMIHYGGDSGLFEDYRKGTLYFFHNTVLVENEGQTDYDVQAIFELSTNEERLWARNNLFITTVAPTTLRPTVLLGQRDSAVHGVADLAGDWIAPGLTPRPMIPDVPVAWDGTIAGFEPRPAGSDPGLVDVSTRALAPAAGSPLLAAGMSLMGLVPDAYLPFFAYAGAGAAVPREDHAAPTVGALVP